MLNDKINQLKSRLYALEQMPQIAEVKFRSSELKRCLLILTDEFSGTNTDHGTFIPTLQAADTIHFNTHTHAIRDCAIAWGFMNQDLSWIKKPVQFPPICKRLVEQKDYDKYFELKYIKKDENILMYKFKSVGYTGQFIPMVTVKNFELLKEDSSKEFHRLMGEIKFECLKHGVNFEANLYKNQHAYTTKANGMKLSFPIYDEAGDPRLMSETQKQGMVKIFNDAKPKTDENTKRND